MYLRDIIVLRYVFLRTETCYHGTTELDHADNPASPDDVRLCVLCWVVLGCRRGRSQLLLAYHPPRCKLFFLLHHAILVVLCG